jgi:hypothetical protein
MNSFEEKWTSYILIRDFMFAYKYIYIYKKEKKKRIGVLEGACS